MRRIVFVVNQSKDTASAIADKYSTIAKRNGFDVRISADFPVEDSAFDGADVCCVVGGDGTILSCVSKAAMRDVPIFGINLGKLGFLANYSDDLSEEDFLTLASGNGRILERELLETSYEGKTYLALNDFVFKTSDPSKVSTFRISADGEFIADYLGDGLIFSTPTGSTAYNLSAGGPLIHPNARAFVMTPICPHTLSNRSLIYDSGTRIKIECAGGASVMLADGLRIPEFNSPAEVELKLSQKRVKFVKLQGHSHFKILRSKLGWAEDPRHHF